MCKLATESASRQPRAYMYSIIFMMSMPMMLTSGFGIAFYRLSRKAARMQQEQAEDFTADGDRG
jgi:LytS/YehU family sensor histidine kinase